MIIQRRSFLAGLVSLIAAPAIVRASSLMPVRALPVIALPEIQILSLGYTSEFSKWQLADGVWKNDIQMDIGERWAALKKRACGTGD